MALPKDAMGRLAAAVVESTSQTGQAGLVVLLPDGNDVLLSSTEEDSSLL